MKRLQIIVGMLFLMCAFGAGTARAESFGIKDFDVAFSDEHDQPAMQAGSHPFAFTTGFAVNTEKDPQLGEIPAGQVRDLSFEFPPGLVGSPTALPRCEGVDFATHIFVESGLQLPNCSNGSVVGLIAVDVITSEGVKLKLRAPLFNLIPSPGTAAKFGFFVPIVGTPVVFDAQLKETPPYNLIVTLANVTQAGRFFNSVATVWGNPSDSSHDQDRGRCGAFLQNGLTFVEPGGECPTSTPNRPFLTLPRKCSGPLVFGADAVSWLGDTAHASVETHEGSTPIGIEGCAKLGFNPRVSAQPTSHSASAPSGLDVNLDVTDDGLTDPTGTAKSDIQKVVLSLPAGVTVNPSQAEGLGVCSEAELSREKAGSEPGDGCPQSSKIGTVEAETPLLEGTILKGSLFIAEPFKNPFDTLIALYMVVKEPKLGINTIVTGRVEPDPNTGQLVSTFDDLPQVPLGHVRAHLREGGRSPLITPSLCGSYTTKTELTPTANPTAPLLTTSSFSITSGVNGGSCPPGGTPPFDPGFTAGSLNNAAGHYSPFYMRLTRRDGDQDLTKFAAKLPPGMVGKLAGVGICSDAQIAQAKAKSGRAELAGPSCPASSQIGRTEAGAGVGSQLIYVPGQVYLAGPYNGAPLSVVAITPAVAGPFDVGTVVVRQALVVNRRTGEVTVDGSRSDPIPHILAGIPLSVRDIRVYVDRPEFTLNPTSCEPSRVEAQLWGGGSDLFNTADDLPFARLDRFQAANCERLGFQPRLSLRLKGGGTKRGGHPRLIGGYRPRPGDANLKDLSLRLPHSAFLDQAHIRTICTRVQFAADSCPQGAIYGHARAFTPILAEPLEGPVYLRSSNHNLPDLVADLHGLVDVEAVARIDSKHGGIRATFSDVPDAPITKVEINMQGGRKGLIVNSTGLCGGPHRADARMTAHNGKQSNIRPLLKPDCGVKKGRVRARK